MERSIVFATNGLIDMNAFTVFGVNAKPNTSSPIGFFGTGLKYAIAVLLRTNPKRSITVYRGTETYTFRVREKEFRDKEFSFIEMVRKNKVLFATTQLPFTTELGKHWELWMAFRELYSNTLDENGTAAIFARDSKEFEIARDHRMTQIVVEGEDFVGEFLCKDDTFLPESLRQQHDDKEVQRFDRPSKFVFYRGMRVHELRERSTYTYNILRQLELTEDRTAKYGFQVNQIIADHYSSSTDKGYIIQGITARGFEADLTFDETWKAPSKEFLETVEEIDKVAISPKATTLFYNYKPATAPEQLLGKPLLEAVIDALNKGDYSRLRTLTEARSARDEVITALRVALTQIETEEAFPYTGEEDDEPESPEAMALERDEMPF